MLANSQWPSVQQPGILWLQSSEQERWSGQFLNRWNSKNSANAPKQHLPSSGGGTDDVNKGEGRAHTVLWFLTAGLKPCCDWLHVAGAVGWRGLTAESWTEGLAPVFQGPADICWCTRQQWKTDHLQRLPALLRSTIKFSPTISHQFELKTCTSRSASEIFHFTFISIFDIHEICMFLWSECEPKGHSIILFHYSITDSCEPSLNVGVAVNATKTKLKFIIECFDLL